MNYTETLFLIVFAFVVAASLLFRPWPVIRQWFLTAFSVFIIYSWGLYSLALFVVIALTNFVGAHLIANRPSIARIVVICCVAGDLAALAAFKYLHLHATQGLGIPLAISFYTFHIISYLTDLYCGKTSELSIGRYLFYLSFFPHVIAGPIVRTWQLVPQLRLSRKIASDWAMGFHFLVIGFFLKSICADNIGAIIDPAWSTLSLSDHWMVPFLYYCQIYGDFGGYSLMALGMARLMGFRLPANFRSPMRAASLQEFWHRWHITLSRWLRDYLYIPLGGSRTGNAGVNLLVTMLLGGLWHGNAWGFIFWGFLHGTGLAVERVIPRMRGTLSWWFVTQIWVTLAWIPFRVPHWRNPSALISQVTSSPGYSQPVSFALIFALPVVVHQFLPMLIPRIRHRMLPAYLAVMTAVLLILNLTVVTPSRVFLYFAF